MSAMKSAGVETTVENTKDAETVKMIQKTWNQKKAEAEEKDADKK
jgi:hypothetical protein